MGKMVSVGSGVIGQRACVEGSTWGSRLLNIGNTTFRPSGCTLPRWKIRCCVSSFLLASSWQWRRPRAGRQASVGIGGELKWLATGCFRGMVEDAWQSIAYHALVLTDTLHLPLEKPYRENLMQETRSEKIHVNLRLIWKNRLVPGWWRG